MHRTRINRRNVLALGTAAAAASLIFPAGARAQATPHTFKVGASEVTVLSDGDFSFPTSFALPGRPESEIEAIYARTGQAFTMLKAEVNVVVIRQGSDVVLIDTGAGPDFLPTLGRLADRLEGAGIKPDSITKVIFTHAHADHLWGVVDPLGEGTQFENAEHVMTAVERDFWLQQDIDSKVGEAFKAMAVGTQRRLKPLARRIRATAPGVEVVPGMMLVDSAGHTPGHVSVLLRSGSEQLLIGGDVLVNAVVSFTEPTWRWGSDMDHDRAVTSRKTILDMLASEKTLLVGYHLPWPGVGRVERKDASYRFVPA